MIAIGVFGHPLSLVHVLIAVCLIVMVVAWFAGLRQEARWRRRREDDLARDRSRLPVCRFHLRRLIELDLLIAEVEEAPREECSLCR